MSTELVPIEPEPTARQIKISSDEVDVLAAWLEGRNPRTLRAYQFDLADFARFLGLEGAPGAAVEALLAQTPGAANRLVLAYRNHLADPSGRNLATATVARRLAAIRSIVKLAGTLGRINWTIGIAAPKVEKRRDTRGPDPADRKRLWKTLDGQTTTPKGLRDRAIISTMFDLGLRRFEVIGLDLADVDLRGRTITHHRKGSTEKKRRTLTPKLIRDLAAWIEARGVDPGALFRRLDRGAKGRGERLKEGGLAKMIARQGERSRLDRPLRPHGLRHASITAGAKAGFKGYELKQHSGHVKEETLGLYIDEHEDVAGKIARKISEERK